MSAARQEILNRVRAAKHGAAAPPIPRDYHHSDHRPHAELVDLFCQRVRDYRAEVQRHSTDQIPDAIAAAATHHSAKRLVIPARLPHQWRPPQLELIADEALTPRELDQLDGVITGCTFAIAQTGTIALTSSPHEGRRALSLIPDLHICILHTDQITGTVPEAISRLAPIVRDNHHPVTLISGPSATSDIELQRVEGVHGPRRLVVLVVSHGPA